MAVNGAQFEINVVDLRSDTLTTPTESMRNAMKNAKVGDDVYGEDPTVNKLEEYMAEIAGKEAGMFVPTGTMGNLTSVMVHCNERGSQIILGDKCHVYLCEQGGAAQIAGATLCLIKNQPDGTYDYNEFVNNINIEPDQHTVKTKLCLVENTHNLIGGRAIPISWLAKMYKKCQEVKIPLHMDGARIFNAAFASGVSVKEILQYCDSASICLSKGLGAPVGSVVVGTKDFISKARRVRKVLGGAMRQSGVLAAAGIVALDEIRPLLPKDHERAFEIAQAISDLKNPYLTVNLEDVETNIFMLYTLSENYRASEFVNRMATVTTNDYTHDHCNVSVKVSSRSEDWVRFTLHHQITDEDVDKVIKKIKLIGKELESNIKNVSRKRKIEK